MSPGADMIPDLSREIWNTVSNQHMTPEAKTFTSTNQVSFDAYLMIKMCFCIWLFFRRQAVYFQFGTSGVPIDYKTFCQK
jgi:hypothetical protein